jgi:SEC-C motif-containing protein
MRSRYSAFALGEVAYLWRTLHPDHPDRAGDEAAYLAELRRSRVGTRFVRLRVLDAVTDPEGQRGEVLFHAEIFEHGADRSFLERSTFLRTPEGWRYRDGVLRAVPARSPELEGMTLANVRFD